MTTLVERLVESWLDRQTERRYQGAFVQLLISEGYNILHNTRHSPIEFGKDIIARDRQGNLCCFQLKGNPGGRVSKSEAQNILPQVVELLDAPPPKSYLVTSEERSIAIFVTNGEIDEEARLLLEGVGERRTAVAACPSKSFQIWSRGRLLALFIKHAGSVWPTKFESLKIFIEILSGSALENPDHFKVGAFLSLAAPLNADASSPAKDTLVTSLILMSEILKSRWYATENHFALFAVSVQVCVYCLQFVDGSSKRLDLIKIYASDCMHHVFLLLGEAREKQYDPKLNWAQRDPLAEADIMKERGRLIALCASSYILWGQDTDTLTVRYSHGLISAAFKNPEYWGLAMIPSLIVNYWALCRLDAGRNSEDGLGRHLQYITQANCSRLEDKTPLPSTYYSFLDCWAAKQGILFVADDHIQEEDFAGRVQFAWPMMLMLAKRNFKQTCRTRWPVYSRCIHEEPVLPKEEFYQCRLSRRGKIDSRTLRGESWPNLVHSAVELSKPNFLAEFKDLAWVISSYIALVPHRAWCEVIMWLDSNFNETFYHDDFLPTIE